MDQQTNQDVAPAYQAQSQAHVTGLSGNEIYCIMEKGMTPGDVGVGNSVHSLGMLRSIGSGFRGMAGGEITQITQLIADGRKTAIDRLEQEVSEMGATGVTGLTTEIIATGDRLEFLSIGSLVHGTAPENAPFSSSADGQELYCQIDAGYAPRRFVFGNVAYSIGLGRGITGAFRKLIRGEVPQYTEIFTQTRTLALQRIVDEAKQCGANAVLNIRAQIIPMTAAGYGMQEMILIGTASYNPALAQDGSTEPVTSDMINQELWSMTRRGYAPIRMLMGTSVYSLGFIGGVTSFVKSFKRGEIPELTKLIYEAREKSISKIKKEAAEIGADDVVGVKIYLYELGSGLIEVLAIGTAVRKHPSVATASSTLIPQAIINDKDTFVDRTFGGAAALSSQTMRRGGGMVGGLVSIIILVIYFAIVIIGAMTGSH